MRKSLFLTTIFVLSVISPISLAGVTETQFQDGSTSYTHTFSGTGNGFAGNLTFPYGAEVTSASFDVAGQPSSTTWGNLSTNTDFGGVGSGAWKGIPPGFAYGNRNYLEVENDQVSERRVETVMKLVGPFSILFLGGFILLIAMGVIVPLFSIQASIGGGF